jgi:hypothetical protein
MFIYVSPICIISNFDLSVRWGRVPPAASFLEKSLAKTFNVLGRS